MMKHSSREKNPAIFEDPPPQINTVFPITPPVAPYTSYGKLAQFWHRLVPFTVRSSISDETWYPSKLCPVVIRNFESAR